LLHVLASLIVSLAIVANVSSTASSLGTIIGIVAVNSLLSHSLLNAATTSLAALISTKTTSLVSLTTA
jgi:hypothetical protein